MEYTKKEKQVIRKTMDKLIRDLDSIWSLKLLDEIKIPVTLEGIHEFDKKYLSFNWYFCMNDDEISMQNASNGEAYVHAKRNRNGVLKGCYADIDEREIMFFREYENIRKRIMDRVQELQNQKNSNMELVERLNRKYENEASIEITLPPSNNQHELKVINENGRSIGILNFGSSTIKLITDGSIKLIHEEPIKVKRK